MLVLVSDLHLVDSPDPKDRRVSRLIARLKDAAKLNETQKCDPLAVAFLGDIFDLLHSQAWLERRLRPWERSSEAHQELIRDIYVGIREGNREFFTGLDDLRKEFEGVKFYFISGNHDRALNTEMGDLARQQLLKDIRFEVSGSKFQDTLIFPQYMTMARHGHECDPRNVYALGRAAVGDFIVVDVLEQLPKLIAQGMGYNLDNPSLRFFRHLSHVVPQDMPTMLAWIYNGISGLHNVDNIWDITEEALLEIFDNARILIQDGVFLLPQHLEWMIYLTGRRFAKVRPRLKYLTRLKYNFQGDPFQYQRFLISQVEFAKRFLSGLQIFATGHTHEPLMVEGEDGTRFINSGAWGRIYKAAPRTTSDSS